MALNHELNHFPRHEKYALCQEIRNAAYDVYQLLVEHQKKFHNKTTLKRLDIRHEQLRMLINLAFELGYFEHKNNKRIQPEHKARSESERRYTHVSVHVNELGGLIGRRIRDSRDTS